MLAHLSFRSVQHLYMQTTDSSCMQPVSYASLALTLGTGAGILWYFNHEREKKLAGENKLDLI